MGRGCRQKIASSKLQGYVSNTTHLGSDSEFVDSSWCPIYDFLSCSQFSEHQRAFLTAITEAVIPKTFEEAMLDEHWRDVVRCEIDALDDRET